MFRTVVTTILFAGSAALSWAATDLAEAVQSGDLWSLEKSELTRKYLQGTRYSSIDESTQRVDARNALTIGSIAPNEMIFKWNGDKLASIQIIIYNKGDDGAMQQGAFEGKVKKSRETIEEIVGQPGKAAKVSEKETGIKTQAWDWSWESGAIHLDCGSTGGTSKNKKKQGEPFQAEFIRMDMGPDAKSIEKGGASDKISAKVLLKSLKKEDNGDVWLSTVPMVDQGQKGYCVPASISRVFAFYGMDGVDQHALAAICGTASGPDGGTRTDNMEESMKKICKKFPVRIVNLEKKHKDYTSFLLDVMAKYNKVAGKMGKEEIPESQGQQFWDVADGDVLVAARGGKSDANKFLNDVAKNINAGTPVLWCVTLGIVKETVQVPQQRGGHMRLIIGYNKEEKTIIYSDSWGQGHEKKSMPASDAAAITTNRYVLKR